MRLPVVALSTLVLALASSVETSPARSPRAGASTLVLRGATAIDPASEVVTPDAVIVLRGGRIAAVGRASEIRAPAGARTIELGGKFVTPGLVDAHIHYGFEPIPNLLAWGVTAILVTGQPDSLAPYRHAAAPDTAPVPRFFSVGRPVTVKGGWGDFGPGTARLPATADDARAQVREAKAGGVDAVKVIYDDMSWIRSTPMSMLPEAVLAAVIDEAHRMGLRVVVHAPILGHAKVALRAGADGLVHGVISEPVDEEFLALMRRNGAAYTATLSLYAALADRRGMVERLRALDRTGRVPARTWTELLEPEGLRRYRAFYDRADSVAARLDVARSNVRRVAAAGIPVVVGTDTPVPGVVPGVSSQMELVLLEEAGLTPMQVLRAATAAPAALLRRSSELGALRPGYAADLLVVDVDPRRSTRHVTALSWVVRGGRAYRPRDLVGSQPVDARPPTRR